MRLVKSSQNNRIRKVMPKRKKTILTLLFLLILSIFILKIGPSIFNNIKRWANTSFCERPVTYTIGTIDERFGVTPVELNDYIKQAGDIWKTAYGRELFVYDPKSSLEINMVYDERQKSLGNIETVENIVEKRKLDIESASQTYESRVNEIKEKARVLNEEIDYWNKKGGAPKEEYDSILSRQKELSKEVDYINKLGEKLNKDVESVNYDISSLNENISSFNSLLNVRPEIGIYTSGANKIDIYFYSDEKYLVNVLAHEMGHALGLGHIDEDGAIMNPELSDSTYLRDADIQLVVNYCSEKNRLDIIKNDLSNYMYTLLSNVSIYLDSVNNR